MSWNGVEEPGRGTGLRVEGRGLGLRVESRGTGLRVGVEGRGRESRDGECVSFICLAAIIYMPGSSHTYIQQNEQYITAHIR